MLAIEMQIRLKELQAERVLASSEGLTADTAYMADLDDELSGPLAYIETTIPSGITIDEYRRSRPQRRAWWHWLRRARGPSGMLIEDCGLIGNPRTALLIGRDGSVDWAVPGDERHGRRRVGA